MFLQNKAKQKSVFMKSKFGITALIRNTATYAICGVGHYENDINNGFYPACLFEVMDVFP